MAKIPKVTIKDLEKWYELNAKLKLLKMEESLLRKRVFAHYFPDPVEGTNTFDGLAKGYVIKGKRTINRNVDAASLTAIMPELREADINADTLVEWKPSLMLKAYRKLSDNERGLFDQALIIKDGSPAMEVVKPAGV